MGLPSCRKLSRASFALRILGLNAYHGDASACIVADGEIVAAAEEERFRRVKHWAGFPSEAIRYCFTEAGVGLGEIEYVAINSDPNASLLKKVGYALFTRPDMSLVLDRIRNRKERQSVEAQLSQVFPSEVFKGSVRRIEHHFAHLASCFFVSPFKEAVTVSIDGFGDFSSAAWGVGRGREITINGRVYFPHSLGIFYQALTQYLGFPHYGDEYKVMGLAPYGEPRYLDAMRRIVRLNDDGSFKLNLVYFRHHKERIDYKWSGGSPSVGTLFSDALVDLLGSARNPNDPIEQKHRDIARSVQAMYEEAFFHLLDTLHPRYTLDSLTLAGGCAMNSVANGKVRRRSHFKRLYVQSAAGDAGGAIGAAIAVWHKLNPKWSSIATRPSVLGGDALDGRFIMDHALWGPRFSDADFKALLEESSQKMQEQACVVEYIDDEDELCHLTTKAIAAGQVVGWFQGRMEWGPRALGNRSILGDPRRPDMKDILNFKIKRRESFRPFAPSVQKEYVAEWFEEDDDVPFMMQVFQIRQEKRPLIPAVTHIDGSGRLQTVYRETNPRYWRLIDAFRKLTGVPMVLNTSFNENEPVVCKPEEALDCFLRTKMDLLVLENVVIRRRDQIRV
jgi:carbamoyltransferase